MLRKLYDWVMTLAAHHHAGRYLAAISFAESSFFPVPPDVMLVPMALAERTKAWRYALIATVFSVLGGLFGYLIGAVLFDTIGKPLVAFYNMEAGFARLKEWFDAYGLIIVFVAGFTPIPYKVFTISSGLTGLSLPLFLAGSVVSRGLRFAIVCGLIYFFGPPIKQFIEKYLGLLTLVGTALLVGGFVVLKYL